MKAFGITSKEPSPQFPGVKAFAQEYGPKLEILYWHIMLAPAGTPKPIIDALNAAVQEMAEDPAVIKGWADTGVHPYPKELRSPEAAAQYLKKEIAHWGQVVRDNKIEPPTN